MSGKKRWLSIGAVSLLSFILLYFFLIWPAQKRYKTAYNEVLNKTDILRSFLSRPQGPPAKNETEILKSEIKILKKSYTDIEKAFISEPGEKLDITPVEFGKILYERKRSLIQEAEDRGMGVPPDLGFKETIPTAEEVGIMVKQLEAISFVIREAILFKFVDIKGIKYHGVEVDFPWERVGIELEIHGDFGAIIGFFYNLGQSEKLCIIKSLEIKRGAEKISKLKAGALKSELPQEKSHAIGVEGDAVEVLVHLECCNYTIRHGN